MLNSESKSSNYWDNNPPETLFIGRLVRFMSSCQSTNEIAMELIKESAPSEGAIIIADQQTAGKGLRGNTWESEPGKNLLFSVILKPSFLNVSNQFYLSMVVALALQKTIDMILPGKVKLKWPNDLLVKKKKIAGILIENVVQGERIEYSVVGIGMNINQERMHIIDATSVHNETKEYSDTQEILAAVCENLEAYYLRLRESDFEGLKKEYTDQLIGFDENRLFEGKEGFFVGRFKDVLPSGEAVIETEQGDQNFELKQVRFVF